MSSTTSTVACARFVAARCFAVGRQRRVVGCAQAFHAAVDCLVTIPLAMIARMTRSAMLEVLGEDYVYG